MIINRVCTTQECFGYEDASGNDVQLATVSGPTAIKVTVNFSAQTYDIFLNSVLQMSNVLFRNSITTIDTVRFFLDQLHDHNFDDRYIDNVKIEAAS